MHNSSVNATMNGTSPRSFSPVFDKMEWIFGIIFSHSLFSLFIIASNMAVLYAFYSNTRLRNTTNTVLMSMAFADIAVGGIVIPTWLYIINIAYNQSPPYTDVEFLFFEAYRYIDQSLGLASVYHLVYLHSLRSYSIVFPMKHRQMSKRPITIALLLIWPICIAFPPVTRKLIVPKSCRNCFVYITLITNIGIPLVVITVANFFLWRSVAKSMRQNQQKDRKALVTIAILIGVLFFCFVPFMIANVIEQVVGNTIFSVRTILVLKLLHFSNSALNPVVYALRNPEIGRTIKKIFCRQAPHNTSTNLRTLSHSNTTCATSAATITS